MNLITIIIPVYNVEQYLSDCIESVLSQTYIEWECILIDDGSRDLSARICDEYAAKDSRFKVIHQHNGGASTARNTGIKNASGEWIAFVDSDDIVKPDYLQNMMSAAQTQDVDFIIGGFQYWHTAMGERNNKSYAPHIYEGEDIAKAYLSDYIHQNGGPCAKLYKRSIIIEHHIEFNPKMHYAEDCNFMLTYFNHINSIAFIDAVDYIYRLLPNSLSHRKMHLESEKIVLKEMSLRVKEVCSRFSDVDFTSLKSSQLQYYGRVVMAITESELSVAAKYKEYQGASTSCNLSIANNVFQAYTPYCTNEKILLNLLYHGRVLFLLIYANLIYPLIRKIK